MTKRKCGNCRWAPEGARQCHVNPPEVVQDAQHDGYAPRHALVSVRPDIDPDDAACHAWEPAPDPYESKAMRSAVITFVLMLAIVAGLLLAR